MIETAEAVAKHRGNCPLCLAVGVELRDSHFVPKGVYRRLRKPDATNPNPVLIHRGKTVQTSEQTKAYLLCALCEQRLSAEGEAWVLKNGLQGDATTFPLLQHLDVTTPVSSEPTLAIYSPEVSERYRPDKLAYFAASVFWRAGVHHWGDPYTYPLKLGSRYLEEFRRYLLGIDPFPENASLFAVVRRISPINQLTGFPSTVKGHSTSHNFFACGMFFQLTLGANTSALTRVTCLVYGGGHPIVATSEMELDLVRYSKSVSGRR